MIFVNGEPRDGAGATIAELLSELGVEARARGVAVAVVFTGTSTSRCRREPVLRHALRIGP